MQIAAACLTNRCQFTGLVPPQSFPALLAATDLVAHASYREGLGGTAASTPRWQTSCQLRRRRRTRSRPHGSTGYLVAPNDTQMLTARIVELSNSPALRDSLAAAGRDACRTRFDHREMTRQIRALYERLLS